MENSNNNNGSFDVSNHQAELNGSPAEAAMLKTKQQSPEPNDQIAKGNEKEEKQINKPEEPEGSDPKNDEKEKVAEENEKLRAYSAMEVQAKRRPYWSAKRSVDSILTKISDLDRIIRTGKKVIVSYDERGNEIRTIKSLNAVQINDAKAKRAQYKLDLKPAKEELRETKFYYDSAVKKNKDTFQSRGRTFEAKKEEKALEKIYNLLDRKIQKPEKDDMKKMFALKALTDEKVFNEKKFQYELKKCLGHLNKGNLPIIGVTLEVSNKIAEALRTHKNENTVRRVF